jgi:hypothetical protein
MFVLSFLCQYFCYDVLADAIKIAVGSTVSQPPASISPLSLTCDIAGCLHNDGITQTHWTAQCLLAINHLKDMQCFCHQFS